MKWYTTLHSKLENVIMSGPRIHILQRMRARQKRNKTFNKFDFGPVSLEVLGSGAYGEARSLYVSSDHAKYLFNCSEGTQRVANEYGYKLTKLNNIFFTTCTWNNLGGLPGIALTLQDIGVSTILLHGSKGIADIFDAIKKFVKLNDLTLGETMSNDLEPFVDSIMKVQYVPLTICDTKYNPINNFSDCASETSISGKRSLSVAGCNKRFKWEKSSQERIIGSMAYICKLHTSPGTLLLEKCVDKGVPPGPLLGMLKAGNDVTLSDGTIVKSKDVCSPVIPGSVFIVLECSTEDYLDSLLENPAFAKHQKTAPNEEQACCVVHFTPENILNNARYKSWMNKFAESTYHMIINNQNSVIASKAIHRLQYKLNLLHPKLFPLLGNSKSNGKELENTSLQNDMTQIDSHVLRAKTLHKISLRPVITLDKSREVKLEPENYVNEVYEMEGFKDVLKELQSKIITTTEALGEMPEYPKVIILGTGSCIPSKTRNTSGILLRIDEERSILLDCGEGTLSQLIRFYGKSNIGHILSSIKAIYVSHLHADHHIGLIGLLQERNRFNDEQYFLLAPERLIAWLKHYHNRFEPIYNVTLIPNEDLILNNHTLSSNIQDDLYTMLNVQDINTVYVKHCPSAFGVAIINSNGQKIVYSGDTMPCESMVKLGSNCDLLIHEATMEDGLEQDAKMKLHSTISQAIGMGNKMHADFTLLTHFSQRYSKIPLLPDNLKEQMEKIGIAYDYMEVSLSEIPLLPLLYPALRLMFNEYYIEIQERAAKRQLRIQQS